jgi:hypothetical protein
MMQAREKENGVKTEFDIFFDFSQEKIQERRQIRRYWNTIYIKSVFPELKDGKNLNFEF